MAVIVGLAYVVRTARTAGGRGDASDTDALSGAAGPTHAPDDLATPSGRVPSTTRPTRIVLSGEVPPPAAAVVASERGRTPGPAASRSRLVRDAGAVLIGTASVIVLLVAVLPGSGVLGTTAAPTSGNDVTFGSRDPLAPVSLGPDGSRPEPLASLPPEPLASVQPEPVASLPPEPVAPTPQPTPSSNLAAPTPTPGGSSTPPPTARPTVRPTPRPTIAPTVPPTPVVTAAPTPVPTPSPEPEPTDLLPSLPPSLPPSLLP